MDVPDIVRSISYKYTVAPDGLHDTPFLQDLYRLGRVNMMRKFLKFFVEGSWSRVGSVPPQSAP